MKTIYFSLALIFSVSAGAQIKQAVNATEQLKDLARAGSAPCATCAPDGAPPPPPPSSLYTPEQALADIKAGNLKFLGRDLMPGSDQNRSCVFKSEKAYVLYNNCMANRKEAPATDIEVINFDGSKIRWYVENGQNPGRISQMNRSDYDGTWSIAVEQYAPAGPNMSVAQLKTYLGQYLNGNAGGACWVGNTLGARDPSTKANCYGNLKPQLSEWAPSAESFWRQPPEAFYSTHKDLRKLVETVPF